MDTKLPPIRSDIVTVSSAPRPTPTPLRVSFGEILAKSASTLVAGAQAAMEVLPGGPLIAAAIRGGTPGSPSTTMSPMLSGNLNGTATVPEGPAAVGTSTTGTGTGTTGIDQSLQQSQEMNLYFLQIQQEVNTQNQTFTTLSNVMKTEADTIKNAIGNLR